jgi:hypothetical protein
MPDNNINPDKKTLNLFGFEIKRKDEKEPKKAVSFVAPTEEDGVGHVINAGGYFGQYLDLDSGLTGPTERDLIIKYRDIAQHPEVDQAINDIVEESIVSDDDSVPVSLILDDLDQPDRIKKLMLEEFENVVELLDFSWKGSDIFRNFYVDGRLYYHKIIDEQNPKKGLVELRYVDPLKIKKVRELIEDKDPKTGVKLIKGVNEYFVYQNDNLIRMNQGLKISKDAITYVTSGAVDAAHKKVLSYLHKAIKPVNQLRMMEDSLVIYRLARAPERRIFYIDVGNLPKGKAEEYMRNIMSKYRNKMVYDAATGELRDDRKHMSMLEDFWLPRREGGRGTEISTLSGGENLGQIEDVQYFQQKVYRALNVPVNRLEADAPFSMGRATEITRDELRFQKFINRLRKRFSALFMDLLKTQLVLKGIVTEEEWKDIGQKIAIDFLKDNHFSELKNAEIMQDRLRLLSDFRDHIGTYYSHEWIRKNVLMQNDKDIEEMTKEIEKEKNDPLYKSDEEESGGRRF